MDNTLGAFTAGRKNNLDFLRLTGAYLVLFSHSFVLAGFKQPGPPFYQSTYGALGVDIFFVISGFLITQSYLRSNSPRRYVWARFLRIFPALAVVVLITTLLLGPMVTTLSKGAYFSNVHTYAYLLNATIYYPSVYLPGVFTDNPFGGAVNGSLWTLAYEMAFYVLVLLLGLMTVLNKRRLVLAMFLTGVVLSSFAMGKAVNVYSLNVFYVIELFTYFGFGMVAYLYRDRIPIRWDIFLFAVAMLVVAAFKNGLATPLFVFFLGYIILFVGYSPAISFRPLTRFGDFSYGVYIWAFPVQQATVYYAHGRIDAWGVFGVAGVISLALAALSWHLIEKRILRLKDARFIARSTRPSETLAVVQEGS